MTSRHPLQICPCCDTKLDSATSIEREVLPKDGNFYVCYKCGEILRFDNGLRLRQLREGELQVIETTDFEAYDMLMTASYNITQRNTLN